MTETEIHSQDDLEAVEIVGKLYHAFIHCIGNKTLKAAYFPPRIRWYTIALWLATIVPPGAAWALQLAVGKNWEWVGLVLEVALMFCVFFPIARYCIRKGLPNEHRLLGITGKETSHGKSLHLPLLKLLFFKRYVRIKLDVNHETVTRSIEFLELINKDSPPPLSTYFRHPVPLIVISSFVVLINAKLSGWISNTELDIQNFFAMGLLFAWILLLGLMAFSWKYSESQSRWMFLRTLRWLELTMRPKNPPPN